MIKALGWWFPNEKIISTQWGTLSLRTVYVCLPSFSLCVSPLFSLFVSLFPSCLSLTIFSAYYLSDFYEQHSCYRTSKFRAKTHSLWMNIARSYKNGEKGVWLYYKHFYQLGRSFIVSRIQFQQLSFECIKRIIDAKSWKFQSKATLLKCLKNDFFLERS